MTREFCTAGALQPERHYFIEQRLNWTDLHRLIKSMSYFVLHAPRQSGKTTSIKEFIRQLNSEGIYNALYINVEAAQAARENIHEGLHAILRVLLQAIKIQMPNERATIEYLEKKTNGAYSLNLNVLNEALEYFAQNASKPLVIFIDEIDSLIGDTLLSVLRQIRAGFDNRPHFFPQSLCLIGLRDVRDYRIWSRQDGKKISTASPFNIKAESLVLNNFTLDEIKALYAQHTQETGQDFSVEALEYVFYLTAGQPWLVNALAYQACSRDIVDPHQPITKEVIDRAKDTLIKRRDTHIDSLLDKLHDERVLPIISAIIAGETAPGAFSSDDLQYVRDLGLISPDTLNIANPIYKEIIPREIIDTTAQTISQTSAPFTKKNGSLDLVALMENFTAFYRENSGVWLEKFDYKEAGPHLLMMAFLQRVINGGGTISREYALGTGRVDILIRWRSQVFVIELKIRRGDRSVSDGLQQRAAYMDTSQCNEGHLVVFDRDPKKPWEEKIFHHTETMTGKTIHVWGL